MHHVATTFVAISLASGSAHADAFIDVLAGIANPIADDDYADYADTSLKLGARIGSRTDWGAFDVQLDVTPTNTDDTRTGVTDFDLDLTRFRALFGGRVEKRISSTASIYARGGIGLDLVRAHATGRVFGIDFELGPDTDLGLGIEFGVGFMVNIGKASIGGVMSLPMAFHFDEDDPNDNSDLDLEYTGVDIDLLFALSIPL